MHWKKGEAALKTQYINMYFSQLFFRILLTSEHCQKDEKLVVKEDISQNYVQIPVDDIW